MKIAIQNCWPNLSITAEGEFITRAIIALRNCGHEAVSVETSDEIHSAKPDLVMITHEFTPKLTQFPTLGLIWGPPMLYRDDPIRVRSILSYDGYMSGSPYISQYLRDLSFAAEKEVPIFEYMYPSCFETSYVDQPRSEYRLFYAGVNWDGERHKGLFQILDQEVPLDVVGPEDNWRYLHQSYRGSIPVDGVSLLDRLRQAGVALCLHRQDHRRAGVPSGRLFEAAAAGAVIIGDDFEFTRKHFQDAMLFIDSDSSPRQIATQIKDHMHWINKNQERARELSRRCHDIFVQRFCLEKLFANIQEFAQKVREVGLYSPIEVTNSIQSQPLVEYIVRVGSRRVSVVEDCLSSLADQTYKNIGIVMVCFKELPGLGDLIAKFKTRFKSFKVVSVNNHTGLRSQTLWAGLHAVSAPLFANQDEDDYIHPNHVASLVKKIIEEKDCLFAYSGVIKANQEDDSYFEEPNFKGFLGRVIKERRHLQFLEPFDRDRLSGLNNYIHSNAWIARREILDDRILTDPELAMAEHFYLYLQFMKKTNFGMTWRPTAVWNRWSGFKDNAWFYQQQLLWDETIRRLKLRTNIDFPGTEHNDELRLYHMFRGLKRYMNWKRMPRLLGPAIKLLWQEGLSGIVNKLVKKGG